MKSIIAAAVALLVATSAFGQVTSSGTGTVYAKPDCVNLSFIVSTENVVASKAHTANRTASTKLFKVFADNKIDEKDMYTTGFHITPVYDDRGTFKNYAVHHHISVKVRDLDKAGPIIDATASDEVRLQHITFNVTNRTELEVKARDLALADAKKKAEQMVGGLGEKLGKLKSVTEGYNYNRPYGAAPEAAVRSVSSTKIASGDQAISVTVNAVWDVAGNEVGKRRPKVTPKE